MAQTLSQIKSLLAAHGLRPKHGLGQNFLHDDRKMQAILVAAAIGEDDLVLEVGPGTGALSTRLFEAGARVAMVEIDRDMAPILQELLNQYPQQSDLLVADVLQNKHTINPDVMALLGKMGLGGDKATFKLIANLPYHVASPLIANLAVDHPTMSQAIVMVQKEVALRLKAAPGGKDYGALGIMIQALCHVEVVTTLPPGCFWPSPTVDSMVVKLVRRQEPLTDDPRALGVLLQKLFSQRRKQLGSVLGRDRAFPEGITANQRPEQLKVEQFVTLARWCG